jgi:hypothetical protein
MGILAGDVNVRGDGPASLRIAARSLVHEPELDPARLGAGSDNGYGAAIANTACGKRQTTVTANYPLGSRAFLSAASIAAGELVAGSDTGWGSLGRITKIGEACVIA